MTAEEKEEEERKQNGKRERKWRKEEKDVPSNRSIKLLFSCT